MRGCGAEWSPSPFSVGVSGAEREESDREGGLQGQAVGEGLGQELERNQGLEQFFHLVLILVSNPREGKEPGDGGPSFIPAALVPWWHLPTEDMAQRPAGREADLFLFTPGDRRPQR